MDQKRTKYNTRHRQEILDFIRELNGVHITVGEICSALAARGTPMGTTTVYRQLERLSKEGLVTRYTSLPGEPACFEYIGDRSVGETGGCTSGCYHFRCETCGRLLHISCSELEHFRQHISQDHEFDLDFTRTVFVGKCKKCRKKPVGEETSCHN